MKSEEIIKSFKSKSGKSVVFRYPKQSDLDDMLRFANNFIAEDTFIELSGKPLTKDEEAKVLNELLEKISKGEVVNLVVEMDGKYCGSADLRLGKRRHSHVAEIGIALAPEARGEGIGSQLLTTLIEEAKRRSLQLLVLNCNEKNALACHVYEKLGFKKAGVIPGAISFRGEYVGEVKYFLPI